MWGGGGICRSPLYPRSQEKKKYLFARNSSSNRPFHPKCADAGGLLLGVDWLALIPFIVPNKDANALAYNVCILYNFGVRCHALFPNQ